VTQIRPITSATCKPGFAASLTGNWNFKRQLFVGNSSVNSRPACSFLRYQQVWVARINIHAKLKDCQSGYSSFITFKHNLDIVFVLLINCKKQLENRKLPYNPFQITFSRQTRCLCRSLGERRESWIYASIQGWLEWL